jgi:hypothetical protein
VVAHGIPDFAGTTSALHRGTDCETQEGCEVFQKMASVIPLMVMKILYCLKKVKVWTITRVMISVIVVMILGNFMTSRNFVLHCHLVE